MSQPHSQTIGKYQIIREIARSNDIVYEGFDDAVQRRVAVKELAMPSGLGEAQQQERIQRFQREARAAGMLTHPNIVTVYDVGVENGRYFIAMEYLDGQTFRQEMEQRGKMDPDRALEVAEEILKGLEYAHQNGVIHRDIKPENIQIQSSGQVKITDFGIARLTHEPNITVHGQVFGTPSYMSPEQVNGKDIDPTSDLFSLGIILYEAMTGTKPFAGDSVVSISWAIVNKEPDRATDLPESVWYLIRKAMEKAPQMRFASARAMRDEIRKVRDQLKNPPPAQPQMPMAGPLPHLNQPYQSANQPVPPPVFGIPPQTPYQATGQAPMAYGQGANPYARGQQPYAGAVPGQPYSGQPYPQQGQVRGQSLPPIPIYYPAPPRKPLLKPEQVQVLGKFFGLVLVFALCGYLIFLALSKVNEAGDLRGNFGPSQLMGEASSDPQQLSRAISSASQAIQSNDLNRAERHVRDALRLAPASPDVHSLHGHYLVARSQEATRAAETAEYLIAATEAYHQSVALMSDGSERRVRQMEAASTVVRGSERLAVQGEYALMRQVLYRAQTLAPRDSATHQQIEDLLRQLGA